MAAGCTCPWGRLLRHRPQRPVRDGTTRIDLGLTSSGQTADGSNTAGRSKPSRSPKVHSAISAVAAAIEVRRSTESTPAGLKKLSTKLVRVNDAGEIQVYVVLTEWSPEHVAEPATRGCSM
jgi:hypothetical protein